MEVSPSHEDNSWWESVGQVESVEKNYEKHESWQSYQNSKKEQAINKLLFFRIFVSLPVFMFLKMIFNLILPVLRTPTFYCVHY